MMSVKFSEILYDSRFRVLSKGVNLHSVTVSGLYVGDLLSFVMAKAKPGQIWLTIQAHPNVIAVASLINLSAVIVVEGVDIPQETIDVANERGVILISSVLDAVELVKLIEVWAFIMTYIFTSSYHLVPMILWYLMILF